MRVITGKYRGRQLKGPKHEGLRPTADRVKEALFNIIGARIIEADLLDLFAGTGSIGIEALSRGANSVVFSDANIASIKLLRENIKFLEPQDQYRILHYPVERTIALLSKEGMVFDLIFLDPPFHADLLPKTLEDIISMRLLKQDGVIIIEHPVQMAVSHPGLYVMLSRSYGDISLTFMELEKVKD